MKFDTDKHYRHSIRLKEYDYSQTGAYFVTVCAHIHGILIILPNKNTDNNSSVGVQYIEPLQKARKHEYQKTIPKSLGAIIRALKSAVTIWCRGNRYNFNWQRNYYEHIIRNEEELNRIQQYIADNLNFYLIGK